MANAKTAQKILTAYMALLGEHDYNDVTLSRLAETADVSLATVRENFASRADLIAGFASMIDQQVLDERDPEMADQPARDRLFDVLMTRLDKLEAYKAGLKTLMAAVRADPALALELNSVAVRSQTWMLTAAGIDFNGVRARLVSQGLAISFAKVLCSWLDDADPGLARTMAKLDRELDKGEDWLGRISRAEKFACKLQALGCRLQKAGDRWRQRRRSDWAEDDMAAGTNPGMGSGVPGDGEAAPAV
ncbi:TetR/AcrR family transcriptional regulator [Roseibium sp. CAU 1637]|uniref:TetR/AcrR family transcriptional regulator n=1 Tax=Roseibium limicola TaxID=2816037 RepID=A0A939EL59_9HYPH|nr:TetR family transcriptional regulator [Roseibium limicola]MBO0343832.1 TetR/AcrR family transcriptional regulator [Roseibium limicola]